MKQAYYNIVEQYGEQASFLWDTRAQVVFEPHYSIDDLYKLDRRIDAHIDALFLSGEQGIKVCEKLLESSQPGEMFAVVCTALLNRDDKLLRSALEQIPYNPKSIDGLIDAMLWVSQEDAKPVFDICSNSTDFFLQAAAISAMSAQRKNVDSAILKSLLYSEIPDLQCRALRLIGELRVFSLKEHLAEYINSDDHLLSFYAASSSVLLGIESARKTLITLASDKNFKLADSAAVYAIRGNNPADSKRIWEFFLNNTTTIRAGLIALGSSGLADNVQILFQYMSDPQYSRVCGEMVSMITGINIEKSDLDTQAPSDYQDTINDNPQDNEVVLQADHFLPWPDLEKVEKWWAQHRSSFQPETRYLAGEKTDLSSLKKILRSGLQRQRFAAALELAFCNGYPVVFNTRAPSKEQFAALNALCEVSKE